MKCSFQNCALNIYETGMSCFTRFSSVQFSHSVMSNSLQPHGLQHARPPCPSSTPRVYSNSCPMSRWCHPTSQPHLITRLGYKIIVFLMTFSFVLMDSLPQYPHLQEMSFCHPYNPPHDNSKNFRVGHLVQEPQFWLLLPSAKNNGDILFLLLFMKDMLVLFCSPYVD